MALASQILHPSVAAAVTGYVLFVGFGSTDYVSARPFLPVHYSKFTKRI
jgi:hypothetical protein